MTFDGVSRFFGHFPNKLNPFWVAKYSMDRLGEREKWAQNWRLSTISTQLLASRLIAKRQREKPIHIVFLCHMPSAWSTYDALVHRLLEDKSRFRVTLLAAPYRHSTFGDDQYHDEGMGNLFQSLGLPFLLARNSTTGEWIDLRSLEPDFFFYQTPYDSFYPPSFRSDYVSSFSAICYAPYYGADLVPNNPAPYDPSFFSNVSFWFAPHPQEVEAFRTHHPDQASFVQSRVRMVGFTRVQSWLRWRATHPAEPRSFKLTILWTPRWNKSQGLCSFSDLVKPLMCFAEKHQDCCLILRPHPLMFQTMRQTGDLTENDFKTLDKWFSERSNAELDSGGDFWASIQKADVLLSDTSSMMVNYAITGKPVIHTILRNKQTTPIGEELDEGFYRVRSVEETIASIENILSGNDYLERKRVSITKRLFFDGNAVEAIVKELTDFCNGC